MTKQAKTMMILLVVLVLLAGGFAAMKLFGGEAADAEESAPEYTVLFSADALTEFSYTAAGETLRFENTEDGWVYADDPEMPLNAATLETMASALLEVKAYKRIDTDEDFGLENGIELCAKSAEAAFYCTVGNENRTIDKVYLMTDDGAIYTSDTDLRSYFEDPLAELLQADEMPEIDTGDITLVSVENGENSFSVKKATERETYYYFSYLLENSRGTTPLENADNYLSSVTAPYLYCEDYAPEAEVVSAAGFDAPSAVLTLTYTEESEEVVTKTYQLRFGDEFTDAEGNAHRYVMPEDSEMLFSVTAEAAENLLAPTLSDMAPAYLAQMNFGDVTRFSFALNGETHTVTQEKGEEETRCTLDGKELNAAFVESFFLDLTLLTSEGGYDGALPDAAPIASAEITLESEDYTLEVYAYNENFCIAQFSGRQDTLLVSIRDVNALADSLSELMENAAR